MTFRAPPCMYIPDVDL